MRKTRKILLSGLCLMFAVTFLAGPVIAAEKMTITGTMNDDSQIVTDDDQVYQVAESEKGDEILKLVGKKVKVTGTVEESRGAKIITVTGYEVIGE